LNQTPAGALQWGCKRQEFFMNRNGLYAVIAILLVAVVGFGIYAYQQEQSRPGVEVRIDEQGVSIDGNG
jgi:hypothetical protein